MRPTEHTLQKRILWIDIARVLATFLIVMQHSLALEWVRLMQENTHGVTFLAIHTLYVLSKTGVPVFFMLSGMGMLRRQRSIPEIYRGRILPVIRIYVAWMLVYGIRDAVQASSLRVGIGALMKPVLFGQYHTWFIATLIGLYAITPLLYAFCSRQDLQRYFLILSFLFTFILPVMQRGSDERWTHMLTDINMNFVVGYVFYYVLGAFLGSIPITRRLSVVSPVGLFLAWGIGAGYSGYLSVTAGADCQSVFTEFSVIGLLIAVCFFFTVRCLSGDAERENTILQRLSHLGIGIYLIHPILLPIVSVLHGLWILPGVVIVYGLALLIVLILSFTPADRVFLNTAPLIRKERPSGV